MDKLQEIMEWKRREIAPQVRPVSAEELHAARRPHPSFAQALRAPSGLAVIAEIKRRSPSAGDIKAGASATAQAALYRQSGADCLSILTDQRYFGGDLSDLASVTAQFIQQPPALPCLRKDFFVHPIQVLQAAQAGASAILIIARALDDAEMRSLADAAAAAGLDALFEVHCREDIERSLACGARIVGVNNRDLAVFRTDLGLTERLLPLLPAGILPVSESGIHSAQDAARVRAAGAKAILVGEALMRATDPAALLSAFHAA